VNKDLAYFIPPALSRGVIVSEARVTADHTMPEQDWSRFDAPAWERLARPSPFREREELPMFLRRQAS
jgi:hypothetical protein